MLLFCYVYFVTFVMYECVVAFQCASNLMHDVVGLTSGRSY